MRVYIFILTVDIILSSVGFIYLYKNFSWTRNMLFLLVYLLLTLNTVACRALSPDLPLWFTRLSAWLSGQWIALMYYILLLSMGHLLLYFAGKAGGFNLPHTKIASYALAAIVCFIGWGTYRAMHPVVRTENITTSKLPAGKNYKIVFLTDLHLGQVLGRDYSEKLLAKVNEQQADLILISGDILDEKQRYIDRENSLEPLSHLSAKQGVYMAFGNHDYLDQPETWERRLEKNSIHVLRDKYVVLDGCLKLAGVNDWSRSKSSHEIISLSKDNERYYSILMDHQPRRMPVASQAGYDLYLAGHTHTGQLKPNRQITKRMYLLDYGRADFGKMTAITNNGYGFWGPPVRTEEAPEMVIINLQGK